MKNSLNFNSAVVSSRSTGLALEIKHLLSFKLRGLIIADSLSCLIWEGFYLHSCNIRNGTYKGQEGVGGNRASIRKKTPRGTLIATAICQTSHHTSHKPQQKTKLMCQSGSMPSYRSPPEVLHHLYRLFSVLHGQEKAMWKCRPGHLLLFLHCVLRISMTWSNKSRFTCCDDTVGFIKSGHIYS